MTARRSRDRERDPEVDSMRDARQRRARRPTARCPRPWPAPTPRAGRRWHADREDHGRADHQAERLGVATRTRVEPVSCDATPMPTRKPTNMAAPPSVGVGTVVHAPLVGAPRPRRRGSRAGGRAGSATKVTVARHRERRCRRPRASRPDRHAGGSSRVGGELRAERRARRRAPPPARRRRPGGAAPRGDERGDRRPSRARSCPGS